MAPKKISLYKWNIRTSNNNKWKLAEEASTAEQKNDAETESTH